LIRTENGLSNRGNRGIGVIVDGVRICEW
jgi:hypothetical protein